MCVLCRVAAGFDCLLRVERRHARTQTRTHARTLADTHAQVTHATHAAANILARKSRAHHQRKTERRRTETRRTKTNRVGWLAGWLALAWRRSGRGRSGRVPAPHRRHRRRRRHAIAIFPETHLSCEFARACVCLYIKTITTSRGRAHSCVSSSRARTIIGGAGAYENDYVCIYFVSYLLERM